MSFVSTNLPAYPDTLTNERVRNAGISKVKAETTLKAYKILQSCGCPHPFAGNTPIIYVSTGKKLIVLVPIAHQKLIVLEVSYLFVSK